MAVNSFREDEYMENTDKKKILSRLLSYLFDYKLAIAGVLVCMGITVGISLVNPLLIEEAIDHYIAQSDFKGLIALGIFALALNVLFIILVKVRMYSMSVISNKILLKIRQDLYEHIQTLSFSFFDSRPTGKILARIIGDVNSLKDVLTNMVTTLIPEFITVIGVVVIMMVKDWRLALASLSTIPIMIAGIFLVQKMSHKRWQIYRKKSSNLNAYVHEDIAGMNVVQSFGAEDETKEIFENLTDEHRNAFVDAVIFADMFGPVIDFCWGIGAMMLYLVGIRFLGFEKVSVGLLVAFGSYINMFWNPIMNLSNFYNNLVTNLTAAERIFDILDTEPDITDADDVEELPEVKGEVTFSHVGFTYDRGTPAETKVLEDVNFVVKPGETIDKLLHNGYSTISLGYIGLYEVTKLMTGVSHTDPKGTDFALRLMKRLRLACDTWKLETGIGFGLYGTPAESLCYRFAEIDKKRFGVIPDVTDKGYYTNSYHVDVREKIDAFEKFTFESQFQNISSGGAISYVEIPNMRHNLEALEDVVRFIYDNIQYAEFNTKSDYCHVCGFDGEIIINDDLEWECPQCHNKDRNRMNVTRRTCGYLGENFWNVGKTKEINARVLHL